MDAFLLRLGVEPKMLAAAGVLSFFRKYFRRKLGAARDDEEGGGGGSVSRRKSQRSLVYARTGALRPSYCAHSSDPSVREEADGERLRS